MRWALSAVALLVLVLGVSVTAPRVALAQTTTTVDMTPATVTQVSELGDAGLAVQLVALFFVGVVAGAVVVGD